MPVIARLALSLLNSLYRKPMLSCSSDIHKGLGPVLLTAYEGGDLRPSQGAVSYHHDVKLQSGSVP